MQKEVPYELGTLPIAVFGFFGSLYPVYERGLAYLARLPLGRALVLSGDKDRAWAAYRDFLALWKNGDPSIRILQLARTEYGALK